MKRILLTLTAAIAAFPIWAAHPSHTNIWTGAGGDFNWNNAANWTDFATGGDWTPPTEATNKDAPAWNLVDFPADGTLVADYAGTLYVGGLLFGANQGTVTIRSATDKCILNLVMSNASPYIYPQVVVPSGTVVDFRAKFVGGWNQSYVYLGGGGTFIVNGFFSHETVLRLFIRDLTFVVGEDWTSEGSAYGVALAQITLDSNSAAFEMRQDRPFGHVATAPGVTGATMRLGGHRLTMRVPELVTNAAEIATSGTIETRYGYQTWLTGGFADACGPMTFVPANGDLHLGTPAMPVRAPDGSRYRGVRNGRLNMYGDAVFGSLVATNAAGGVSVAANAALTVAGAAGTKDVVNSPITGEGTLAVNGADGYTLELGGANDFATLNVTGGKVVTTRPYRAADGLVAYYTFDDDADGANPRDVTPGVALATIPHFNTTLPSFAADGAGGGRCAHFDFDAATKQSITTANEGTTRADLLELTNSFTVIMWIRPDRTTMDGTHADRRGTGMELFYNGWPTNEDPTDRGMAWMCFASTNTITISGFEENALHGVTLPVPNGTDVFDGDWHQFAFCYDAATRMHRVWLDGALFYERKRNTDYHFYVRGSWRFGARVTHNDQIRNLYHGDMDNIQIWNRALTADEIEVDCRTRGNIGTADTFGQTAPIAHWTFDDPLDAATVDASTCPGVNGRAAQIDGADSGRQMDIPAGLDLTQGFSITVRVMPKSRPVENRAGCLFLGSAEEGKYLKLAWCNWKPFAEVVAFGWSWKDNGIAFPLGGEGQRAGWKDFAVVYDKTAKTLHVYWDGETLLEWTNYVISDVGTAPRLYLGYNPITAAAFPEYVDDCRLYDRALTAAEVREIVRENANAGMSNDNVLSSAANVTVAGRGELEIGHSQTVGSLAGDGTLSLPWAKLTVSGASSFNGTLKGHGDIHGSDALALTGDGREYDGRVTAAKSLTVGEGFPSATFPIQEGAALAFRGDGTDEPCVDAASGTVVLPTMAMVDITDYRGGLVEIPVARGRTLKTPADFSGWTVTGVAPVRFRVRDNALWLRIGSLGCRVILR